MKLIKQTLFSITITRAGYEETYLSVEAENMEEALQIAREVIKENYKEWRISSIAVSRPCYRTSTKTITVEV
ncbi:MAG: hypothetical protein ACI4OP_02895 [Candidatus Coprovivens sp.]